MAAAVSPGPAGSKPRDIGRRRLAALLRQWARFRRFHLPRSAQEGQSKVHRGPIIAAGAWLMGCPDARGSIASSAPSLACSCRSCVFSRKGNAGRLIGGRLNFPTPQRQLRITGWLRRLYRQRGSNIGFTPILEFGVRLIVLTMLNLQCSGDGAIASNEAV